MEASKLVKSQYELTHRILGQIMNDVNDAIAASVPAGTIQHIGSIAAHSVMSEDMFTSMAIGSSPLFKLENWYGRLGVPENDMPRNSDEWAAAVKLDLAAFNEYALKVYSMTEGWLDNADADTLSREVQSPFGKTTALELVGGLGLYHITEHSGEIAALKGIQGLKGLPF